MRQSYIIAFIVLIVALAWMMPAFITDKAATKTTSSNKPVTTSPVRVGVIKLNKQSMSEYVTVNGQTKASRIVELRSRTNGRFSDIKLNRGATVKENQLIAQMDIDDRQSRLDESKAILQQRTTEYDVAKGLESKGFNSKVKLDTARANLATARTNTTKAKLNLSYTKIKSPFSGVLEDTYVEVGTYVHDGDKIATIVDLNPMDISVFVSERYISMLKLGMTAKVSFTEGQEINGKINYMAKIANKDTRTFRVDVRIDNPDNKIVSGLTARVSFLLPERMAYKIPLSSLVLNDKGIVGVKIAKEIEAQNSISWMVDFIPVTLLREEIKTVWVDDLPDKAMLIISGHEFTTSGQDIIPVEQKDSK